MEREKCQLRVLAVDDDSRIRLLLAEVLAGAGCRVLTASNSAEAMTMLTEQPVDLLITDYEMPGMNGFELIRWSKAHFPRLPTVLVTGRDARTLAALGPECGSLCVLPKPFSVVQLHSLVARIRDAAPPQ